MNVLVLCLALLRPAQDDSIGSYAQELAATRRAGLPTTPADMKRAPIPRSENAAPLYVKLAAMLKARPESNEEDDRITAIKRTAHPTAEQMARARAVLNARRKELALIREIAARPLCRFDRDWSLGPAMQFSELSSMRAAARLLAGESTLLLREGRPLDAIRDMASGFTIASHANQDNMVIGYLVGVAVDAITVRTLGNFLGDAGFEPGVASAVQSAIQNSRHPLSLVDAMRTETLMQIGAAKLVRGKGMAELRQLTTGDEPRPALSGKRHQITPSEHRLVEETLDRSGAYLLHKQREIVSAIALPYPAAKAIFERIDREVEAIRDPHLLLVPAVLPVFARLPFTYARYQAKAAVVTVAAAVLDWKTKHGAYPDNLGQAMNPAPTDPFDLKPLRYRQQADGFVVYSVGETGEFDGNARDQRQYNMESVFRYPAPPFPEAPPPPH